MRKANGTRYCKNMENVTIICRPILPPRDWPKFFISPVAIGMGGSEAK